MLKRLFSKKKDSFEENNDTFIDKFTISKDVAFNTNERIKTKEVASFVLYLCEELINEEEKLKTLVLSKTGNFMKTYNETCLYILELKYLICKSIW